MRSVLHMAQATLEAAVVRGVFSLPQPVRRLIAGSPIRLDGQQLALDAQLLLRLQHLSGQEQMSAATAQLARDGMSRSTKLVHREALPGVIVADRTIPTRAGSRPARLYRPQNLVEPGPMLVFFHGGGWVIGDLDSHDDTCRFLARNAGMRVLSVDYRLAPEHPFPASLDDCLDAYAHVADNAAELGTSPDALAVGGDSAGGNLAAAVAQHATRNAWSKPVLQLLLYPAVDATTRRRSRDLFGNGFLLTDTDMDWFMDNLAPDVEMRDDPRLSVLLAEDLSGLPTAYVVTAGFDPLRDEGERYAQQLSEAGCPVVHRRFADLIHGFVNMRQLGGRFHEAMVEVAGTVRAALQLEGTKPTT